MYHIRKAHVASPVQTLSIIGSPHQSGCRFSDFLQLSLLIMHRTALLTRRCCQQSSAWLCCSASQAGPSRVMAKIALTRSHALYTAAQQGTSSRTAALSGSSRQPRFISSSLPRPMTMQKEASFASSFPQHHRSFRTSAGALVISMTARSLD